MTTSRQHCVDSIDGIRLLHPEKRLTKKQIDKLEHMVSSDPSDNISRTKILGYYSRRFAHTSETLKNFCSHLRWLIINFPTDDIHLLIRYPHDAVDCDELKTLWLEIVASHPNNVWVLENAASFATLSDWRLSEELFLRAESLEPHNDRWPTELCHLYKRAVINETGVAREHLVQEALSCGERALKLHEQDHPHCYLHIYRRMVLEDLTELAFEAGMIDWVERLEAMK